MGWPFSLLLLLQPLISDAEATCNSSIPVRSLSASSAYQEAVAAQHGRLDNEAGGGAWCPRGLVGGQQGADQQQQQQEFLQLDLGEMDEEDQEFILRALVVQGRWANGLGQEFAEQGSQVFLVEKMLRDSQSICTAVSQKTRLLLLVDNVNEKFKFGNHDT